MAQAQYPGSPRPGRRRRWLAGGLSVLVLLTIAACTPTNTDQARWVGSAPTPTGSAGDAPDESPGGSADPTGTATGGTGGTGGSVKANLSQLPKFGPVPIAIPVRLPEGPNAGWYSSIPTTQQVAFLTIDDGFTKDPQLIDLLRASGIRVTLFLEINAIKDNPEYFHKMEQAGAVIEAHTISHPELKGQSYNFQHNEICGSADKLANYYGRRPLLFRPPYGDKDATTLRVVKDCGMKAAFFWKETVDAGIVRYQEGNKVKAGDIILMHFRPAVVRDFLAALNAIHDAGLTPALLEDYISGYVPPVSPTDPPIAPEPTPTPTPTPSQEPSPAPGTEG